MLLGVIYTIGFVTPKYTSTTTLLLATSNNSSDKSITTADITLNSNLVSTYGELITSSRVVRPVMQTLGINENEEKRIKQNISVSSVKGTEVIEISVTNLDPEIAAKIANEIAIVFIDTAEDYYKINNIHVVDEAEVSTAPSNINHTKDVIIFAFIGIVVSVAYVLILNMLDTTVKSAEDVEKQFNITILASIPMCTAENQKNGGKK